MRYTRSLGFRIKKIEDGLRDAKDLVVKVLEPFIEDNNGEIIKRRGSIPYINIYK